MVATDKYDRDFRPTQAPIKVIEIEYAMQLLACDSVQNTREIKPGVHGEIVDLWNEVHLGSLEWPGIRFLPLSVLRVLRGKRTLRT
jgi:hypothetical protein